MITTASFSPSAATGLTLPVVAYPGPQEPPMAAWCCKFIDLGDQIDAWLLYLLSLILLL